MKILVINDMNFYPTDGDFQWKVTSVVGIHLAQKIISGAYDWCDENHKEVCRVKVTDSRLFGKNWKIIGGT
jgi:hypothetical protein